ncbi:MAG: hypothetical protein AB7N76_23235 [Planctomycetota bacterium]
MRRLGLRAGALLVAALLGGGLALRGALTVAPAAPPRLPPLTPRGEVLRGVEVFVPGRREAETVDLAHAVHAAVGRLLGGTSSAAGLRVHLFGSSEEVSDYVWRATARRQRGTCFVRLGGERLIALDPRSTQSDLQHELAHDATLGARGEGLPGWFSEGLAMQLEPWRAVPGRLYPRPDDRWPERFLELARQGALPPLRVLSETHIARFQDPGAYARSWASVLALRLLARRADLARLDPGQAGDPDALDALGQVLAEHWAASAARRDAWLASARAASSPAERELQLALAYQVEARWLDATADPLEGCLELAEAARDLAGPPALRARAAAALTRRRGTQADWAALARELEGRGYLRLAGEAARQGLRAGGAPSAALVRLAAGAAPSGESSAEAGPLRLRSSSWDAAALRALAARCGAALAAVRGEGAPQALELRVEAPGPARAADVLGWPGDGALEPALIARLRAALPALAGAPAWRHTGREELLAWGLDPWRALRARAALRAAQRGPGRLDWERDRAAFSAADPALRAAAAAAGPSGTASAPGGVEPRPPFPWDLAADPGDPAALARALELLPVADDPRRRFLLLRALDLASPAPGLAAALAAALERGGSPQAARALR